MGEGNFDRTIHTSENIAAADPDSLEGTAEYALWQSAMPPQIKALEEISKRLDEKNWRGALDLGLVSSLGSIKDYVRQAPRDLLVHQPELKARLDQVEASIEECEHTIHTVSHLIERNEPTQPAEERAKQQAESWGTLIPYNLGEEERHQAIILIKNNLDALRHDMQRLAPRS